MALGLLKQKPESLKPDERDLLVSEEYSLMALSKTLGMLYTPMLRQMGSRDMTRYRALAIVEMAQQKIQDAKRKRKKA